MDKILVYDLKGNLLGHVVEQTCCHYLVQGLGFIIAIKKESCAINSNNIIVKE